MLNGLVVDGLVDLVADELEELSEGLLILGSGLTFGQLEVNLSEVHADRPRSELFKELVGEVQAQAVAFVSSGGLELISVDTVDVETDPVLGLAWLVVEVPVHFTVNLVDLLWLAVFGLEDGDAH